MNKSLFFTILIFFSLLTVESQSYGTTLRPLVIKSANISQYEMAIEGIKEAFRSNQFQIEWETQTLGKDVQASQLRKKVLGGSYDLIFTVGSGALDFVKQFPSRTPVVYTMVMGFDSRNIFGGEMPKNITGVNLRVEPSFWFNTYKRLLPNIKKVGVIYNPKNSKAVVEKAELVAEKMGFTLVKVQITSPEEVRMALEVIRKKADALWTVTDSSVINSLSIKQILIYTLKHKIPLFTVAPKIVRLGGLLSISSDYKKMGVQTGEVGMDIMQGKAPTDVSIAGPREPLYSINMHTARILGLDVPGSVLNEIQIVFQ